MVPGTALGMKGCGAGMCSAYEERIDKLFSMNGNFCKLNDRFLEESEDERRDPSDFRLLWLNPNYMGLKSIITLIRAKQKRQLLKAKLENKLRDEKKTALYGGEASIERNPRSKRSQIKKC